MDRSRVLSVRQLAQRVTPGVNNVVVNSNNKNASITISVTMILIMKVAPSVTEVKVIN